MPTLAMFTPSGRAFAQATNSAVLRAGMRGLMISIIPYL